MPVHTLCARPHISVNADRSKPCALLTQCTSLAHHTAMIRGVKQPSHTVQLYMHLAAAKCTPCHANKVPVTTSQCSHERMSLRTEFMWLSHPLGCSGCSFY